MTRRERLENRIERRRQWAESRSADASRRFDNAHNAIAGIPPGQPILVGHHSEGRHRAALKRCDTNMRKGCESEKMASHHESKADNLEHSLEKTIFSDDENAVEAIEQRIAEREAQSVRMRLVNKAHAKFIKSGIMPDGLTDEEQATIRLYKPAYSWEPHPFPPYSLSNLRGRITADKKRLASIKFRAQRTQRVIAAGGVLIEPYREYSTVYFSEKPERSILDTLRDAKYQYTGGGWFGLTENLPQVVRDLTA